MDSSRCWTPCWQRWLPLPTPMGIHHPSRDGCHFLSIKNKAQAQSSSELSSPSPTKLNCVSEQSPCSPFPSLLYLDSGEKGEGGAGLYQISPCMLHCFLLTAFDGAYYFQQSPYHFQCEFHITLIQPCLAKVSFINHRRCGI